jgi:hypothetical protein
MSIVTEQIHRVLLAKADALIARDHDILEGLIHENFAYLNAGGKLFDKLAYIDAYCLSGELCFVEQRISNLEVRQTGEFAIATMSIADKFRIDGQIVGGGFKSMGVFCRPSGEWRWLAGQTMKDPTR